MFAQWLDVVKCTDKAIAFEFQNLAPAQPTGSSSITLDITTEGNWEGELGGLLIIAMMALCTIYMQWISWVLPYSGIHNRPVLFLPPVVQIEPSLSGVQVLLDQLNQTGNLKEFCKSLRLKFKDQLNSA